MIGSKNSLSNEHDKELMRFLIWQKLVVIRLKSLMADEIGGSTIFMVSFSNG